MRVVISVEIPDDLLGSLKRLLGAAVIVSPPVGLPAPDGLMGKRMAGRLRSLRYRMRVSRGEDRIHAALIKRDGKCCAYCGAIECRLTIDHVIPGSRGGTNALENLRLACGSCNSSKGTRSLEEWKASPYWPPPRAPRSPTVDPPDPPPGGKRVRTDATRKAEKLRKQRLRARAKEAGQSGTGGTSRSGTGGTDGGTTGSRTPDDSPSPCDSGENRNTVPPSLPEQEAGQAGRPAEQPAGQAGQAAGHDPPEGREGGTLFDLGPETRPRLLAARIRGILAAGMPAVLPSHLEAYQRVLDRLAEAGHTEQDFVDLASAAREGLPGYRSTVALGALLGRYEGGEYPAGGLAMALEKAQAWKRRQARAQPARIAHVALAAKSAHVATPTVPALQDREARTRELIAKRDAKGSDP